MADVNDNKFCVHTGEEESGKKDSGVEVDIEVDRESHSRLEGFHGNDVRTEAAVKEHPATTLELDSLMFHPGMASTVVLGSKEDAMDDERCSSSPELTSSGATGSLFPPKGQRSATDVAMDGYERFLHEAANFHQATLDEIAFLEQEREQLLLENKDLRRKVQQSEEVNRRLRLGESGRNDHITSQFKAHLQHTVRKMNYLKQRCEMLEERLQEVGITVPHDDPMPSEDDCKPDLSDGPLE
ncbi:uncharacterized protein [Diadema antillarum]|uniref:uncharacterized protein n=1 Tax=Diadema antillarum TaxID=105358 RepID=UPI003A86F445